MMVFAILSTAVSVDRDFTALHALRKSSRTEDRVSSMMVTLFNEANQCSLNIYQSRRRENMCIGHGYELIAFRTMFFSIDCCLKEEQELKRYKLALNRVLDIALKSLLGRFHG